MTVNQSLCFEDLPLGEEWVTRGRTVSESELTAYIGLAGDFNPLYADRQAAGQGPNQGVLIPGALIIAVAFGLGSIDLPPSNIVALVGTTWRFLQTVRVGDTLHTRWRLNRKRPVENPIWGLAVWQIE
ncbi:MAG: MaoC family dehydratase, partial [Candidatus Dormibacteraceae bacterium]